MDLLLDENIVVFWVLLCGLIELFGFFVLVLQLINELSECWSFWWDVGELECVVVDFEFYVWVVVVQELGVLWVIVCLVSDDVVELLLQVVVVVVDVLGVVDCVKVVCYVFRWFLEILVLLWFGR